MKDKAKSEARKAARTVKDVVNKVGVALRGKAYLYSERSWYEDIQYLAWAIENRKHLMKTRQHTEEDLRESYNAAVKWAQDSLAAAIIDNDVGFFERMAELAKMKKAGKPIDEKTARVGCAVIALETLKKPVNGDTVTAYLNERWPKPKRIIGHVKGDKIPIIEGSEWDGGEVRKILRQNGIRADTKKRLVT